MSSKEASIPSQKRTLGGSPLAAVALPGSPARRLMHDAGVIGVDGERGGLRALRSNVCGSVPRPLSSNALQSVPAPASAETLARTGVSKHSPDAVERCGSVSGCGESCLRLRSQPCSACSASSWFEFAVWMLLCSVLAAVSSATEMPSTPSPKLSELRSLRSCQCSSASCFGSHSMLSSGLACRLLRRRCPERLESEPSLDTSAMPCACKAMNMSAMHGLVVSSASVMPSVWSAQASAAASSREPGVLGR